MGVRKGPWTTAENSSIPQRDSGPPPILSAEFVSRLGSPLGGFHQTFKLPLELHLLPAVELGSVEWNVRIGIQAALLLYIAFCLLGLVFSSRCSLLSHRAMDARASS